MNTKQQQTADARLAAIMEALDRAERERAIRSGRRVLPCSLRATGWGNPSNPRSLGYSPDAIDQIIAERASVEALAGRAEPLAERGAPEGNKNAVKGEHPILLKCPHPDCDLGEVEADSAVSVMCVVHKQQLLVVERRTSGNNVDIINIVSKGGTSSDYLTRRIARDRPDILARMKAGEFRSGAR